MQDSQSGVPFWVSGHVALNFDFKSIWNEDTDSKVNNFTKRLTYRQCQLLSKSRSRTLSGIKNILQELNEFQLQPNLWYARSSSDIVCARLLYFAHTSDRWGCAKLGGSGPCNAVLTYPWIRKWMLLTASFEAGFFVCGYLQKIEAASQSYVLLLYSRAAASILSIFESRCPSFEPGPVILHLTPVPSSLAM